MSSHDVVKCAETLQKLIAFRRERGTRSQVCIQTTYQHKLLMISGWSDRRCLVVSPSAITILFIAVNPSSPWSYKPNFNCHNRNGHARLAPHFRGNRCSYREDWRGQDSKRSKQTTDAIRSAGSWATQKGRREGGVGIFHGLIFSLSDRTQVLIAPQLPSLYNEILNHPNTSDDVRRATESKLLRHKQSYLCALPISSEKTKVASELEDLVNGVVLLGIPDELAWTIFIEGKDCDTIGRLLVCCVVILFTDWILKRSTTYRYCVDLWHFSLRCH